MNSFIEKLQNTLGHHSPKEIEELVLDNLWDNKESLTIEEKAGLEQYTNLIHLSLNNLGLKSLKNFPAIKGLYYLSDRRGTGRSWDRKEKGIGSDVRTG